MTFEAFVKRSGELNEMAAFPMLVERASMIGYKIDKVVFRGYKASEQLQAMHDSAIKTRTKLNLEARLLRADKERAMEVSNEAHLRDLKALSHAETLRMKEAEAAAEQAQRASEDAQRVRYLRELKEQGVDLTAYLCAKERKGEKIISIEQGGGGEVGVGCSPHLHLNA